jgi:hypothetical protein
VVYFLGKRGLSSALSWQWVFLAGPEHPLWIKLAQQLAGKTWLLYESSWLNRRLGRTAQTDLLFQRLTDAGVQLIRPYAQGKDCIDAGGESLGYISLKPSIARQMAMDWWERDCQRAQGILSMSSRASAHFRNHLPQVDVFDLPQFLGSEDSSKGSG